MKVFAPYDLSEIQELKMHSGSDVEAGLAKARQLADQPSKRIPLAERIQILKKTAELVRARREEFALQAAREGGKPYKDSLVEIDRAINGIEEAWVSVRNMVGKEVPMNLNPSSANRWAITRREPIGVCVAVSAFNHPFNLIVHQAIPAFAVGCPVLIKPAMTTPLSAISLVECLWEAGAPKDWVQLLLLENEDAQKLVVDPRVDFLSFIGSAKVGWMLKSQLAPGARCALEHGGAAPVVVGSGARWDAMMPALAKGGYYHAGQVCVSVQRIFIPKAEVDSFCEQFIPQVQKMKVGDPTAKDTDIGPLILPREVDRVEKWVQSAVEGGATSVLGSGRISDTVYSPTLLVNPPPTAEVSQQEIFGPVVCVYGCESIDDAISKANQVSYSFQASVFSQNLDEVMKCAQNLNGAAVMVNDHTAFRVDWMPFAGRKVSGLGVGGIEPSMEEMTEEKLVVFHSPELGL